MRPSGSLGSHDCLSTQLRSQPGEANRRRSSSPPQGTPAAMSFAAWLCTGLRLAEIVGLNVGDVFAPDATPRSRVRISAEIAKGGRGGDIFLPDARAQAPE